MKYRKKSPTVEAEQNTHRVQQMRMIRSHRHDDVWFQSMRSQLPGDWFVTYENGDEGIVSDELFRQEFEPITDTVPVESRKL